MDIFFGYDTGTFLSKRMIQQINNLRQLCSLILDEIYLKINHQLQQQKKLIIKKLLIIFLLILIILKLQMKLKKKLF